MKDVTYAYDNVVYRIKELDFRTPYNPFPRGPIPETYKFRVYYKRKGGVTRLLYKGHSFKECYEAYQKDVRMNLAYRNQLVNPQRKG